MMKRNSSIKLLLSLMLFLFAGAIGVNTLNAAQTSPQQQVIGKFALLVDGQFVGYVSKVAGGFAEGNVVEETPSAGDFFIRKHLETPSSFKDITLTFRASDVTKKFYDWIAATLSGDYTRHNGAIVYLSYSGSAIRTLRFNDAQIVEVIVPRLDTASKDPLMLIVKLALESSINISGGTAPTPTQCTTKTLLNSSFRLVISGLNLSGTRAIETIDVKIPNIPPGLVCDPTTFCPPRAINFPNVDATLLPTNSQSIVQWYEQFVSLGTPEKNGSLEILDANLSTTVLKFDLFNLGAISLEETGQLANSNGFFPLLLRMYSEYMTVSAPGICN